MPTTSPEPESTHAAYWRMKLTLPVDDPFWNEHHPGDRWNCKCSLEATDEPVVRPADLEPTQPQRGLENNSGKDGHTFSDKHPYFPSDCSHCFAYKKGGITNRLKALFLNREKDCYNCPFIDGCIGREVENKKEYERLLMDKDYTDVKYDKKSGRVKATHIGHNKPDEGIDLEQECQDLLYRWGHRAILRNEFYNMKLAHRPPSLDLELDGIIMDIRSITTAGVYGNAMSVKNNQLGRVKKKTGIISDSLCLHFHEPEKFSEEQLLHDIDWFKKHCIDVGTTQRIKHIYVVVNGADSLKIYDL